MKQTAFDASRVASPKPAQTSGAHTDDQLERLCRDATVGPASTSARSIADRTAEIGAGPERGAN